MTKSHSLAVQFKGNSILYPDGWGWELLIIPNLDLEAEKIGTHARFATKQEAIDDMHQEILFIKKRIMEELNIKTEDIRIMDMNIIDPSKQVQ